MKLITEKKAAYGRYRFKHTQKIEVAVKSIRGTQISDQESDN